MKKIKNQKGETLVETLAAVLIIALSSVMIMTASVTAAKIDRKVRETDVSCTMSTDDPQGTNHASINYAGGTESAGISMYRDNGYYFYYSRG